MSSFILFSICETYCTLSDPKWQIFSADDLRRRDQEGHQSLREKYGRK